MRVDPTVRRETAYVAISSVVLSVIMELVFVIIGMWDYTVLLGNLLGAFIAVLNFFLMGLTVQSAVLLDEKQARDKMKLSMTLRSMLLMITSVVGLVAPCFHPAATIIPLFFVRIAVAVRPIFIKDENNS